MEIIIRNYTGSNIVADGTWTLPPGQSILAIDGTNVTIEGETVSWGLDNTATIQVGESGGVWIESVESGGELWAFGVGFTLMVVLALTGRSVRYLRALGSWGGDA